VSLSLRARFPKKLGFLLFEKWRYKVLHGGRGGAKSWGVARALLLLATERKLLILCAREFQNSITESVHRLLCNQIEELEASVLLYDHQQQYHGTERL
jgi:phage terminase large subunit